MRATPKVENCMHVNRRGFLRVSAAAAGGLLVSLYLDLPAAAQEGNQAPPAKVYPPDAFVNIRPDGKIVIQVNRLEFGQGIHTGLPRVLADEMDADWAKSESDWIHFDWIHFVTRRLRLFGCAENIIA